MYHPFASQSPTTSFGTRKNDGTTSSPAAQCCVHVAVVDGVVLLEEAQARRGGGSSSSSNDDNDNDDDISSRASSVSLVSSPVKYMIAALENQQRQRCDKEDAKSNNIGGRSSLLSFDDYDEVDGDDDDEVTDVSSLQTGASVFHLPTTTTTPPAAAAAVVVAPPPSSKTAYGGIMAAAAATTTTDDREYSTEDEESTMFAMSSASDPINLGHRTIHTMSILALTRSNDPLDYSDVVQRGGGGGGGNNGNTVVTIGPLGDELSYADATSNDNQRGAGHTELLADDEDENRGRGNNNILDDSRDDDDEYDNYFGLTNLIAYSSKRVKIVLVTTVAFIVGMLVLTMVFSATASYTSDGFDGTTTVAALGESTSIMGGTEETMIALMTTDDITTTTIPTLYPSLLPSTTSLPSYTPSMSSLPTVTNLPSNIPTVSISPSITTSPSFEPTTMLSNNNMLVLDQVDETVGGKISFYLMADGGSRIKYWSSMLANLSILNNHAFLVHL